jgi:hypothetical protein
VPISFTVTITSTALETDTHVVLCNSFFSLGALGVLHCRRTPLAAFDHSCRFF